nr:nucleotidyl transferase AbiEii/AbiGii toxin family protein [Subtercola sp. Z020]
MNRPTQDVDLFTNDPDPESFDDAVDGLVLELEIAGFSVEPVRRSPRFAQLRITTATGHSVDMDLAVNWRERDPVALAVGPVLSLEDAVGNKVSALYSRPEARDYLDVDAIRLSGWFTDEHLLSARRGEGSGL